MYDDYANSTKNSTIQKKYVKKKQIMTNLMMSWILRIGKIILDTNANKEKQSPLHAMLILVMI